MMKYAPIEIPTLCRSKHFIRLIESLKRNAWAKYTDIYIGLDYPPEEKYRKGWSEICQYIETGDFSIFASFNVVRREVNYGFFRNSKELIDYIYEKYDRVIELADDLEVSPNFIEYMDKCLDAFEDDSDVVTISGYAYDIDWQISEGATCMKQDFNASEWGRASWKAKWRKYAPYIESGMMLDDLSQVIQNKTYLKMIDACLREYIPAATSPRFYKTGMMRRCCDIAMRAYLAVEGKYCISPVVSKVRNYGFDGSGLFCQGISEFDNQTALTYDYDNQLIDDTVSFEVISNNEEYLDENRKRLNRFDMRTKAEMAKTWRLLWMINRFGIWAAKIYMLIDMPFDVMTRAWEKIRKKWNKV